MNLLNYKNRFTPYTRNLETVCEINGYTMAMSDIYELIAEITENNPAKRFIDAVRILDAIQDTNAALIPIFLQQETDLKQAFKELSGVNLGSDKVNGFLNPKNDQP